MSLERTPEKEKKKTHTHTQTPEMGDTKSISPSQVILLVAASILLTIFMNSSTAVADGNKFCEATEAGEEMALCVKLVKGAKTWEKALKNTVRAIAAELKKDKPFFDSIKKHLPGELEPISKESILATCKDAHESVVDSVNKVLENIKDGDPQGSIDTELSAALSALSDCTDGMDQFGVDDPDIVKTRDVVEKYASISLAVSSLKKA